MRRSRLGISLGDPVAREKHRKRLGRLGEEAAVRKLLQDGYRIIHQNYLCRSGEVDIIAEHQDHVVFVEVKTRSPRAWDTPASAVTSEKQARVIRAATYYMSGFRNPSLVRYDIVGVITDDDGKIKTVEVKRNAFGPSAV